MLKVPRAITGSFLVVFLLAAATGCTSKNNKEPVNTLHLVSIAKIKGLDPAQTNDMYSARETARVYEGLLQYHYLKRPYVLIPALAESMPEISKDGRTITFQIKKGVLFQDDPCFKATMGKGREVTAEDFVYSFKRIADLKNTSPNWWLFEDKIVGLNEWRESTKTEADYSKPVEGLKAVDRYTFQIKLIKRSAQFLYALAMPQTSVVPQEAVSFYNKEFLNHPVGTGPYRLADHSQSNRFIWDRNPTFRKEFYPTEGEAKDKADGFLADAGKTLPLADRIVLQVYEEDQPRWLNFMSGKVDLLSIPKDNFSQAIDKNKELTPELKAKGLRLSKSPELDVTHFGFNMADPLLGKNKLLRQALSLAYDTGPEIELFYNGRAIPAQGPIPPGLSGYDPEFKNPYAQANLTKAKELLAKAGFPEGKGLPTIEYYTLNDSNTRQRTEYVQKQLAGLGVKLNVNTNSWPEFDSAIKNRKAQMWGIAWGADYPDAENFLQLFYSKNASPGPNDSNYSNPEFDRLYEKSLSLYEGPERTALYRKMVEIIVEDAPWIFGVHRTAFELTQKWVKNYKQHAFDLGMAKYYGVDPELKK